MAEAAVRFLTRTFRNVLYVRVGKLTCGVRSARERSFEEASGETEVGRRLLPPPLAPEPRPLPPLALAPRTRPRHANRTQNLNQRPLRALFCPKLDNSCCYARYSCGNDCNIVVKLVQEYHCFLYILLPFCGNSSPRTICFLGKQTVNKRALALRNSLLSVLCC